MVLFALLSEAGLQNWIYSIRPFPDVTKSDDNILVQGFVYMNTSFLANLSVNLPCNTLNVCKDPAAVH